MIGTVCRYSLREALQNRLLALAAALLLVAFLLAEFIGAVAITEHRAVQAAVAGTVLRLGAVLLMALLVVTTLLREQHERTLELLLALPHPRVHYLLGKLAAYLAVAAALALACGALAALYAAPVSALRWGLSLACELWLVAALGLLLAMTFRQGVSALAALGAVYVLARAMDGLLLLMGQPLAGGGAARAAMEAFVQGLAWVLPSLYRFTDTGWLAWGHGGWDGLGLVAGQTAIYVVLLCAAAAFDMYRREF